MDMRRAAPWIAVGAGVVLVILLVADIVMVSKLRTEVSALATHAERFEAPATPNPRHMLYVSTRCVEGRQIPKVAVVDSAGRSIEFLSDDCFKIRIGECDGANQLCVGDARK